MGTRLPVELAIGLREPVVDTAEVVRRAIATFGGAEQTSCDGCVVARFRVPSAALACALEVQRDVAAAIPFGIQVGEPAAPGAAAVMELADAGQVLLARGAFEALRHLQRAPDGSGIRFAFHGLYLLKGVDEPVEIHEAGVDGVSPFAAPAGSAGALRADTARAGERIGPFEIEQRVGAGGMGVVYKARAVEPVAEIEPGATVALKLPHAHLVGEGDFLKRFLLEGEIGSRVRHDNVVRTYCAGTCAGGHYLAMEYVEGQTLRALLEELGRFSEELALHVAREVALALEAIHAGNVVHRDLKPDNVLITGDQRIKVMDLGVARLKDAAEKLSSTGWFVGSVLYAAPEQFRTTSIDGRADLYALGLLLYEVATGSHPYEGENATVLMSRHLNDEPRPISELNPRLSPFFEELVKKLLCKDPDDRFPSAATLGRVLVAGERSTWWGSRARALRAATRRPLRRVRVPRETALHGRDAELETLRECYEKVREGSGRVLLIEGEAGIGKSRLVDEFVGELAQAGDPARFLYGSYPPGGAATAAGAFLTAFREFFGTNDLESHLAGLLGEAPALVPSFAAFLRGEPPPEGREPLTRDSLQTVFVEVTRALAREAPVVFLVDDLHFAPEEGRALFAALAHAAPEFPLLLAGTARAGLPAAWTAELERLDSCARLALPRLGPKDLTRLLVDAFGSERPAEELAFRIARKSDGNPFFVFEIIRGLREGGYLAQEDDGRWVQRRAVDDIEIPSSVMDLIRTRFLQLDEDERDLLDVAACCGFEFDPLLVAAALGEPELRVLKSLGRIERRHRVVHASGRRYVFDHHQLQEAVYRGLSDLLRERYHAALARAIEERVAAAGPDAVDGEVALQLSDHALAGGLEETARRNLSRALDHLVSSQRIEAAARVSGRALACAGLLEGRERLAVLARRRKWLGQLGRREEERRTADEAVALADRDGEPADRALARMHRAAHLADCSDVTAAFDELAAAVELAQEAGDRGLEGRALRSWGVQLMYLGRYDEARERFARAIRIARETSNRVDEVASLLNLAVIAHYQGRFAEALAGFRDCAWFFRESGETTAEAVATTNLGFLLTELGRLEEGRQLIERALRAVHSVGVRKLEAHLLDWLGHVAGRMEDRVAAKRRYRDALALRRRIDDRSGVAQTLVGLARVEIEDGELEEAEAHLAEAAGLAKRLELPDVSVLAPSQRALLPGGETAPVHEALERYEPRLRHRERMEVRFNLWRVDRDRHELERARELLEFLREHAPAKDRETLVANVPLHRAIAAADDAAR